MFAAATRSGLRSLGMGALTGVSLLAMVLTSAPARAEGDLSIAMPGWGYYTPPPAYYYGAHWFLPVTGGIYLGFGHYHHHYW